MINRDGAAEPGLATAWSRICIRWRAGRWRRPLVLIPPRTHRESPPASRWREAFFDPLIREVGLELQGRAQIFVDDCAAVCTRAVLGAGSLPRIEASQHLLPITQQLFGELLPSEDER